MALAHVARAAKAGLDLQGEPSLLRGVSCGKAVAVQTTDDVAGLVNRSEDNYRVCRWLVSIWHEFNPRRGDVFEHPDVTARLDEMVSDNGYVRQFYAVPVQS